MHSWLAQPRQVVGEVPYLVKVQLHRLCEACADWLKIAAAGKSRFQFVFECVRELALGNSHNSGFMVF